MSLFKNLKRGLKNYFLYAKLAKIEVNEQTSPAIIFMILNKTLGPFKKIPESIILKAESDTNQAIVDAFKAWNKAVSFVTNIDKTTRNNKGVFLNKNELMQMHESFFNADILLTRALKDSFDKNNTLVIFLYANSLINSTNDLKIQNEVYKLLKREYKELDKIFARGIKDGLFVLSFDEKKERFVVDIQNRKFFNVPENLVADAAMQIIKSEDNDSFKKYSKLFLKAIDNKYVNTLSFEDKMQLFNFITSNINYVKDASFSFDKQELFSEIEDIQYYLKILRADNHINIRLKNNLLKEKSEKLLALSQMFILENIRNFFDSKAKGENLIRENEILKKENYEILKKVSEEITKSTGDKNIKKNILEFNTNIKHYINGVVNSGKAVKKDDVTIK